MLISLNELKKLVDITISDDNLLKLIGSRLVEIESVDDWSKKFKRIFIAEVLEAKPIEGTHLHLCKINVGAETANFDPEHEDFIQIVCSAPNVKSGMFTAWIAPGAIVPATFDTSEPFKISSRKLRGFESFGMLAAPDELSLGPDHEGIIEFDPKIAKPGMLLSDTFDLNDKILEIENKSLTHRPDCFGLVGFAREIAGILGQKFTEPLLFSNSSLKAFRDSLDLTSTLNLKITNPDPTICPLYSAFIFDFKELPVRKKPYFSADDLFLIKSGMRPISPIVDATNLIMLKTGQPLHAFDYDKFLSIGNSKTPEIGIRLAHDNENLILLDDKKVTLNEADIVITSSDIPVALAGAMGGKSTEIDTSTKRIIVEIASFSLYNLRKTQMSHGLFSEAITRFTKGRPATDLAPAASLSAEFFSALGGHLVNFVANGDSNLFRSDPSAIPTIRISSSDINCLLGSNYSPDLIKHTLENVNFSITEISSESSSDHCKITELSAEQTSAKTFDITPPFWRTDITIKEDIIEEIGRLLGYDNLPLNFPLRPFVCSTREPILDLKSHLRTILSDRLGANEVLTYSFVSEKLQRNVNENPENSYHIINSISPALEVFRQSLISSLIDKTRENLKSGHRNFTLYELNQISSKSLGLTEDNVPKMETHLGLTTFGDFYHAKFLLSIISQNLNLSFSLKLASSTQYFEPLRSLEIWFNNQRIGFIGEIKSSVLKHFKLSPVISAIELNLEPLIVFSHHQKTAIQLSRFPSVSRDLTFRVPKSMPFETIESALKDALTKEENLIFSLTPTSIFQKPQSPTKNLSFSLKISHLQKTLDSQEISVIIERVVNKILTLGAEVV